MKEACDKKWKVVPSNQSSDREGALRRRATHPMATMVTKLIPVHPGVIDDPQRALRA